MSSDDVGCKLEACEKGPSALLCLTIRIQLIFMNDHDITGRRPAKLAKYQKMWFEKRLANQEIIALFNLRTILWLIPGPDHNQNVSRSHRKTAACKTRFLLFTLRFASSHIKSKAKLPKYLISPYDISPSCSGANKNKNTSPMFKGKKYLTYSLPNVFRERSAHLVLTSSMILFTKIWCNLHTAEKRLSPMALQHPTLQQAGLYCLHCLAICCCNRSLCWTSDIHVE